MVCRAKTKKVAQTIQARRKAMAAARAKKQLKGKKILSTRKSTTVATLS